MINRQIKIVWMRIKLRVFFFYLNAPQWPAAHEVMEPVQLQYIYGHEGWHVKDRAVRIQDLITFKKLFFSLFRSIQEQHPVNMRYICATKLKDSCIYAIFLLK